MEGNGPEAPPMKEEELVLFRGLINREFGIVIRGDKRLSLSRKLSHRLSAHGLVSYRDYYNLIVSGPSKEELFNLVSHVTNNETYFQREREQIEVFAALLNDIRRNDHTKRRNRIRIVSAGCATGEELYTLNVIVRESGLFVRGWDISLTGIDVNRISLAKAEKAVYTKNSFRALTGSEGFSRKYFDEAAGLFVLKIPYRSHVHFRLGNLLDPGAFQGLESADIIFCRNVFIYMNNDAIRRVAENLHGLLADDGYLFIGSSESLLKRTDLFVPEYRDGVIVYRKALP